MVRRSKKLSRVLGAALLAVEAIEMKCGGPGGTMGPCPGGGSSGSSGSGGKILSRSEGSLKDSLTFKSDTHSRLGDKEAKSLVPKGIKTRTTAEFDGVLNTKSSIEEIQKAFVGSGWEHTVSVQQTVQYGVSKMDHFSKDGTIAQVDSQSSNRAGWLNSISLYRPKS